MCYMLTLWKSMILPKLEYCSQLWCPTKKGDIYKLEEVQRTFIRKICFDTDESSVDYWDRLSMLGLYSWQRRRERYRILYAWQVLEGKVPNVSSRENIGIQAHHNARTGRSCVYPRTYFAQSRLRNIYDSSMVVHGSKLFNCLPRSIRNLSGCSLNCFKQILDNYLRIIPDKPVIPGYVGGNQTLYGSNSLLDILPHF